MRNIIKRKKGFGILIIVKKISKSSSKKWLSLRNKNKGLFNLSRIKI